MPILLLCLGLVLLSPIVSFAQTAPTDKPAPPPPNLNVVAIGGFLGLLDGFCELPGGAYDVPVVAEGFQGCADATGHLQPVKSQVTMGGLLGAADWIKANRKDFVLIQGNNQIANFTFLDEAVIDLASGVAPVQASDFSVKTTRTELIALRLQRFWEYMAALNADAIGLGPEDFVRSLRDPRNDRAQRTVKNRGSFLYRWIDGITTHGSTLPLIGSNAVVKYRGDFLNKVEDGDYSLDGIEEKDTAGWLSEIKVNHPKEENLVLTLYSNLSPRESIGVATTKKDPATGLIPAQTTLTPTTGGLQPNHEYWVEVQTSGQPVALLHFKTHLALTPRANNGSNLAGFPVITKSVSNSPALIVSLVDPSIKSLLGKEAWKWDGAPCPGDECEIDFMEPGDALKTIVGRASAGTQPPFVMLLSSLEDTRTQETLEAFPEIRLVVLPQESLMLGRATRAVANALSGDLGMSAVFDAEKSEATTLAVRPEWLGETGAQVAANVSLVKQTWLVVPGPITVRPVAGAALQWDGTECTPDILKRNPKATCTSYFMQWPILKPATIPYGAFENYLACEKDKFKGTQPATPDECKMLNALVHDSFNAFAGDALRRATGSELALVPGGLIDGDFNDWLNSVVTLSTTRVLSRLVLERAIYRSFRIVRASIAGDQFVTTMDKALKAKGYSGSCIVGLSEPCAASIDKDHSDQLVINGRIIDSRMQYSIAIPEGLAEELELEHSEGRLHTTDAVSAIHERLSNRDDDGWYIKVKPKAATATFGERLASRANGTWQHNAIISSLEFAYANLMLTEPPGSDVDIKQTDIDFRSITPARTRQWKGDLDLVAYDHPRVAVRGILNFDYKRRFETTDGVEAVSLETNTATAGARFDYKIPAERDVRLFAGYYLEGEIHSSTEALTAKITTEKDADGYSRTRSASGSTPFRKNPLQFEYIGLGIDTMNTYKLFSKSQVPVDITKISFQYAAGTLHHAPSGITIGGVPQDATPLKTNGPQGVLDAYFAANESTFDPSVEFEYLEQERPQKREQLEFNFEPSTKVAEKTWKLTTELRARLYQTRAGSPNSIKSAYRMKFALSLPVYRRLEIVPAYEKQWAELHGATGWYTHSSIQVNLKLPFVLRVPGWGWLFR